ncbi:MAG TPA: phospholipid carrier-dependent glycosyltransferase, partial [Thermoanaerobaculia bacterium]|nr:phospholipid carrier-dependent glycosyltransferase [Thermoanaerobaculia bacterium]
MTLKVTLKDTSGRPFELSNAAAVFGLGLLLVGAALLSFTDSRLDSATADEPVHVVDGIVQARSGTWNAGAQHPPLVRELYGAAAIAGGAAEPPRIVLRDYVRSTRAYLFAPRAGKPVDEPLLCARAVAIGFFLALLLAGFAAAGGGSSGFFAAALLAGQTALFPHGHLAGTDVPVTFFMTAALVFLAEEIARPRGMTALALVVALAAALATKGSAAILLAFVPLAFLVAAWRAEGRRRRYLAVEGFLAPLLAVVLLSLLLRLWVAGDPPGMLEFFCRLYGLSPADQARLLALDRIDHPLARYAFVLVFHLRESQAGLASYFLGEVSSRPSPLYHLVAIAVKSPVVWLAAGAAGTLLSVRKGASSRARLLYGFAVFYLIASLPGSRIGVRHMFPLVAAVSAGAAILLAPLLSRHGRALFAAALLIALSPLAFSRRLGGNGLLGAVFAKPPLADSNLDWGQDLLRLRRLLGERRIPASDVAVAYFGGDVPAA